MPFLPAYMTVVPHLKSATGSTFCAHIIHCARIHTYSVYLKAPLSMVFSGEHFDAKNHHFRDVRDTTRTNFLSDFAI
jgi:hypothetical protein